MGGGGEFYVWSGHWSVKSVGKKCLVIDQWDWSYCGGSGVQVSLWPLGEDLLCVGDSTADLTISVSALWQMWNSEN